MKTLLKVLTPTISTIGIATISLTSCGTTSADGYTAIPRELLDIDGTTLKGFKDPYEPIKNYSKITVPKDIETVDLAYGSHKFAFDCVKKIDFESDSNWKTIFDIASLPNLEILVFPPKLSNIDVDAILNCKKLNTLDISNVKDITCLTTKQWFENNMEESKGTLIIKSSQKDKVADIKKVNSALNDWEVKEV